MFLLLSSMLLEACGGNEVDCKGGKPLYPYMLNTTDACSGKEMCAETVTFQSADGRTRTFLENHERCVRSFANTLPAGDYSVTASKTGYQLQTTAFTVEVDRCGDTISPTVINVIMTPLQGCPQK